MCIWLPGQGHRIHVLQGPCIHTYAHIVVGIYVYMTSVQILVLMRACRRHCFKQFFRIVHRNPKARAWFLRCIYCLTLFSLNLTLIRTHPVLRLASKRTLDRTSTFRNTSYVDYQVTVHLSHPHTIVSFTVRNMITTLNMSIRTKYITPTVMVFRRYDVYDWILVWLGEVRTL